MKKAMMLVADYWHSKESLEPLYKLLFENEEDCLFTTDPEDFYKDEYELLITFKDPIENNQIPTPTWCDEKWTKLLFERVNNGMNFMPIHAALADLSKEHPIVKELYESVFITHPAQCPLSFEPIKEHPILEGITNFTFPQIDEHYVMEMMPLAKSEILAYTVSEHGKQPGLWINSYGKGKIAMFTPGHDTPNLTCPEYVQIMKNMIKWCEN